MSNFMKTDAYKTYTKAYETFIKKNPGYEDKISEKSRSVIYRGQKNRKEILLMVFRNLFFVSIWMV